MNREAVERLIATEYQGLLALLRRTAQDPQLAADLLNDALVTTLGKFDSGRVEDPSHIGGYVFQVAMNLLRNHKRKFSERTGKRVEVDENLPASDTSTDGVEEIWAQRVRRMLTELPSARDRELLKRFYLDEEEKESICSSMKLAPLMFDKVIFRAKKRMLSLLESQGLRKSDFFSFLLVGFAAA